MVFVGGYRVTQMVDRPLVVPEAPIWCAGGAVLVFVGVLVEGGADGAEVGGADDLFGAVFGVVQAGGEDEKEQGQGEDYDEQFGDGKSYIRSNITDIRRVQWSMFMVFDEIC